MLHLEKLEISGYNRDYVKALFEKATHTRPDLVYNKVSITKIDGEFIITALIDVERMLSGETASFDMLERFPVTDDPGR